MSDTEIRTALETRLATVSDLPIAAYRAAENDSFTSPKGKPWIRHRLSFGAERLRTLPAQGGYVQRDGTWRLLLFFPLDTGTDIADALARAVLGAFPVGATLIEGATTVHCDGGRRYGGGRDIEPAAYCVPVDVRWHALVTNTVV